MRGWKSSQRELPHLQLVCEDGRSPQLHGVPLFVFIVMKRRVCCAKQALKCCARFRLIGAFSLPASSLLRGIKFELFHRAFRVDEAVATSFFLLQDEASAGGGISRQNRQRAFSLVLNSNSVGGDYLKDKMHSHSLPCCNGTPEAVGEDDRVETVQASHLRMQIHISVKHRDIGATHLNFVVNEYRCFWVIDSILVHLIVIKLCVISGLW